MGETAITSEINHGPTDGPSDAYAPKQQTATINNVVAATVNGGSKAKNSSTWEAMHIAAIEVEVEEDAVVALTAFKTAMDRTLLICHNCGGIGHKAYQCPCKKEGDRRQARQESFNKNRPRVIHMDVCQLFCV